MVMLGREVSSTSKMTWEKRQIISSQRSKGICYFGWLRMLAFTSLAIAGGINDAQELEPKWRDIEWPKRGVAGLLLLLESLRKNKHCIVDRGR